MTRFMLGLSIGVLGLALGMSADVAMAQSVQVLGDYRDWSSYTANDGGGVICFATTSPQSTQPIPDDYGDAHIYVTHRLNEGVRAEFNVIAGYEFATDSIAQARVGGRSFELYTQGDAAWLADPSISQDFAGYIRAGSALEIEGTTVDGIKVVQSYSLSGATAAQRAVDGAC